MVFETGQTAELGRAGEGGWHVCSELGRAPSWHNESIAVHLARGQLATCAKKDRGHKAPIFAISSSWQECPYFSHGSAQCLQLEGTQGALGYCLTCCGYG